MGWKPMAAFIALLVIPGLVGCKSEPPKVQVKKVVTRVERVDLDKVLQLFKDSLDEKDLEQIARADPKRLKRMAAPDPKWKGKIMASKKLDSDRINAFLRNYARRLNRIRLTMRPISVVMLPNGTVLGFYDANRNGKVDKKKDKIYFTIVIDQPRNRLIASDDKNMTHRDIAYGCPPPRFFSAHFLGAMLNGQQVTGFDTSRFASLKMAPPGYFRTARRQTGGVPQAGRPGGR